MLTDEEELIRSTAAEFSREVLKPGASARDKSHAIEPQVLKQLGELGFLGMRTAEEWGGVGCSYVAYACALMEIAAGDGAVSTLVSVHNSPVCSLLDTHASDHQKETFLRPLAEGRHIGAFALTEADTGSDAAAIRTRATRDGSDYVVNGSKMFITSGKIAGTVIIFAVTDPSAGKRGISAFVTSTGVPGFSVSKIEDKLGQKASDTAALMFDNLRIPESQRIGAEGAGLKIALSGLEAGRIGIAAQCVGMAQAAFDVALTYAKERKTFGKLLLEHQAVAFRLADAKTQIEAARQLVLHAARLKDRGEPCLDEACMAKLFASEMAEKVCSAAIQTLGGYGYISDFPVERIYRDVRVCQIYEGTSDIQKIIIARGLAN
ncbi:acyl-CoA dehydrogenase family protein [Neorhizobium galegae]|uniref:acyl-CoA dehydrogenase family protein n=1 Tax=Neorhizobium galegae TaxID=399 RepID=UPI0006229BB1|nr:acyl-CoA dehydrogenase family protein [Neorhizobium galegae]CDZ50589.1 Acyl-CoA dehydrogenase [Neorhizobium galegae bv. orientalis]